MASASASASAGAAGCRPGGWTDVSSAPIRGKGRAELAVTGELGLVQDPLAADREDVVGVSATLDRKGSDRVGELWSHTTETSERAGSPRLARDSCDVRRRAGTYGRRSEVGL